MSGTKSITAIGEAPNSKVVMLPYEASSLIGSLAGIKELLAEMPNKKA